MYLKIQNSHTKNFCIKIFFIYPIYSNWSLNETKNQMKNFHNNLIEVNITPKIQVFLYSFDKVNYIRQDFELPNEISRILWYCWLCKNLVKLEDMLTFINFGTARLVIEAIGSFSIDSSVSGSLGRDGKASCSHAKLNITTKKTMRAALHQLCTRMFAF